MSNRGVSVSSGSRGHRKVLDVVILRNPILIFSQVAKTLKRILNKLSTFRMFFIEFDPIFQKKKENIFNLSLSSLVTGLLASDGTGIDMSASLSFILNLKN